MNNIKLYKFIGHPLYYMEWVLTTLFVGLKTEGEILTVAVYDEYQKYIKKEIDYKSLRTFIEYEYNLQEISEEEAFMLLLAGELKSGQHKIL